MAAEFENMSSFESAFLKLFAALVRLVERSGVLQIWENLRNFPENTSGDDIFYTFGLCLRKGLGMASIFNTLLL